MNDLKQKIRTIPDFPAPGILFRDITTLLADPGAFNDVIERFVEHYQ
ncbi:MAG TPA: adenine phosphoribosyltransferase, partial [Candidatus Lambdaproteobacteria bacterium]|nr:adenine phosphoribosyltransferase [Candidatus Lambdaproteobacteria bacterium]HIB40037.1 adenine phosphoribosyltransferase [Candidatus Lambdaproteobacteria bacterium]HIC07125.1 adenine phosphoribosyltransferase [Candidatus Lambdaproteobacteria bacterium]